MIDISEIMLELGLSASSTDEERAIAQSMMGRASAAIKRFVGYDPFYATRTEILPSHRESVRNSDNQWEVDGDVAVLRNRLNSAYDLLALSHVPIRSVTSLYIDDNAKAGTSSAPFPASTLKTEGIDFWPNYDIVDDDGSSVCTDGFLRSIGSWPTEPGTIKVTYLSGYTDAELHGETVALDASSIRDAFINETVRRVKRYFSQKKTAVGFIPGTITGEKLGDYSYTVDGSSAANLMSTGDLASDSREMLSQFRRYDL